MKKTGGEGMKVQSRDKIAFGTSVESRAKAKVANHDNMTRYRVPSLELEAIFVAGLLHNQLDIYHKVLCVDAARKVNMSIML